MLGYSDKALQVEDKYGRPVILFRDQWTLNRAIDKNKGVEYLEIHPSVS